MNQIERLRAHADEASSISDQIEETETLLKALKARRQQLANKVMLDLMLDLGIDDFTRKGIKYTIKDYLSGTFPRDPIDRQMAFDWLEENGFGEIIKNIITVSFPKGDNDRAEDCMETLRDLGCRPERTKSVHPMTLKKHAKEYLEDGRPINLDILGLTAGQTVNIKKL